MPAARLCARGRRLRSQPSYRFFFFKQKTAYEMDLLFSGRKTMSGIPIKSSVNADQTRVDFLDLSHWGRAVLKDIDFYEVNGNTVFPIYGASGGLAASYIFYFDTAFQV